MKNRWGQKIYEKIDEEHRRWKIQKPTEKAKVWGNRVRYEKNEGGRKWWRERGTNEKGRKKKMQERKGKEPQNVSGNENVKWKEWGKMLGENYGYGKRMRERKGCQRGRRKGE